ncbi:MAG: NACHT domain-containing protein, partial [Methanospirillum sp.]|nr:NACHT domain-containing protein [Methanospirillum sp.]
MADVEPIDIAILTILPEEYNAVHSLLINPTKISGTPKNPNNFAWVTGEILYEDTSYRVVLGLAGNPGVIQGANITTEAIRLWNPTSIFLVGIAGGMKRKDLKLGDVVIANSIWFYDYGKIGAEFEPRNRYRYPADNPLLRLSLLVQDGWQQMIQSRKPGQEAAQSKALHGLIASGNQVVDNPNYPFFQSVIKTDTAREILAVEMEGAGAADAVSQQNESGKHIGFLMIRGISDMISENSRSIDAHHDERDLWKKYAAESAAAFTVRLIQKGLPTVPQKHTFENTLHPISFDLTIAENLGKFVGREWLIERIDNWVNDPNGRKVYWILGGPGIGKTALAIWYNHLRALSAFYLFQYDNTETTNPQRFVRTLAYQLSTRFPAYRRQLEKVNIDSKTDLDGPALLNELILTPFHQLGNQEEQVVILLDGLDEIFLRHGTDSAPTEMIQTIRALYHRTESMPFRFIFSSRDNQAVQTKLQLSAVERQLIDPDGEQNRDDIRQFLRKELDDITETAISEEKLEEICTKNQGFFIYASFFCKAVREKVFSLDEPSFPADLSAMFLQYFERQFHDITAYEQNVAPGLQVI